MLQQYHLSSLFLWRYCKRATHTHSNTHIVLDVLVHLGRKKTKSQWKNCSLHLVSVLVVEAGTLPLLQFNVLSSGIRIAVSLVEVSPLVFIVPEAPFCPWICVLLDDSEPLLGELLDNSLALGDAGHCGQLLDASALLALPCPHPCPCTRSIVHQLPLAGTSIEVSIQLTHQQANILLATGGHTRAASQIPEVLRACLRLRAHLLLQVRPSTKTFCQREQNSHKKLGTHVDFVDLGEVIWEQTFHGFGLGQKYSKGTPRDPCVKKPVPSRFDTAKSKYIFPRLMLDVVSQ